MSATHYYDVVVAGAGAVGLAFAAALKREAQVALRVAVIDPAPDKGFGPARVVALSPGAAALLQRLGAWREAGRDAQPILEMAIYDGAPGEAVRIEQLTFAHPRGEPLAHMAPLEDVTAALAQVARSAGVDFVAGSVAGYEPGRDTATLRLEDGRELRARLAVAADGANSKLGALADVPRFGWATGQSGIVATVAHEHDHEGRAEQHFLPAGPLAILPLTGRRVSLVWNEPTAEAERLIAASEPKFLEALTQRFTPKLGTLSLVSAPAAFPLAFRFARTYFADRLALAGDAAHLVHPLAGQGLNLGLRDAAALAEILAEEMRLGLDPGGRGPLEAYQRRRRFDALTSGLAMDAMNRTFSNDFGALRFARDLGLRAVDRADFLKRRFVREAAGDGDEAPRLMRGLGL